MRTVAQIEALVRFYVKDDTISLSISPGLDVLNKSYRELAALKKWFEFRDVVSSDDIVTSSSTRQYDWPNVAVIDGGDATTTSWAVTLDTGYATTTFFEEAIDGGDATGSQTVVFSDVTAVEVGIDANNTSLEWVLPPPDEAEWNEVGNESSNIPVYYVRYDSSGSPKIELRAQPGYSGGTIQITGYKEPDELLNASSATVFQTNLQDDILCKLVAAEYLSAYGEEREAIKQIDQANNLLSKAYREVVPAELRHRSALSGDDTRIEKEQGKSATTADIKKKMNDG